MKAHLNPSGRPNNVSDIGTTCRRATTHSLYVGCSCHLLVCLAVIILLGVLPAAAADLGVADNSHAAGRQDVKSDTQSMQSENAALASPANDAATKAPSPKKKEPGTRAAPPTPYGYAPSAGIDQSKYRKALQLEREVGQNMRSIDNAIRQMNTDINRIRTLERRF